MKRLKSCLKRKKVEKTIERKKYCPVCGELAAVLNGDPAKYGDKAVPWHTFIRVKYDCQECRDIINRQSNRIADKRYRARRKAYRETTLDVIGALRAEAKASKERVGLLERENRAARQRIAELEARRQ